MFIRETLSINQQPAKYYRLGTYGDRLWDDKGWLDATGESVVEKEKTETENKNEEAVNTKKENEKDNLFMGMTNQQLLVGLGIGVLVGVVAYYGYKKMKNSSVITI